MTFLENMETLKVLLMKIFYLYLILSQYRYGPFSAATYNGVKMNHLALYIN